MITLTDTAQKRLKYLLENEKSIGMLLELIPSGCNGYAYKVSLLEVLNEDLLEFEKVYIKKDQLPLLSNTTIDYVKKGLGWSWEYLNPQQTTSCGCGSSVSINQGLLS